MSDTQPQIEHLRNLVEMELVSIPRRSHPENLYDPVKYILNLGGKRFRPLLVLLSYSLFKDDPEKAVRPAVGVELFHNFTLVHDDIMDKAPLRRGNPTVHEKWGENTAILSGDVMMVEAYNMILDTHQSILKKVLSSFNDCAAKVCEGQQIDVNFQNNSPVSDADYIEMIRLKTAVLLGFSMELGALIAGATPKDSLGLKSFGEALGIGFQLKDDLLDAFGEQGKFGKQIGGDIIANKQTFLWIKAMEVAQPEQKRELQNWATQSEFNPAEKVEATKSMYQQLNIPRIVEGAIQEYFDQAFTILDNLEIDNTRKEPLLNFVHQLIQREH